jgi:hypothetical protein
MLMVQSTKTSDPTCPLEDAQWIAPQPVLRAAMFRKCLFVRKPTNRVRPITLIDFGLEFFHVLDNFFSIATLRIGKQKYHAKTLMA